MRAARDLFGWLELRGITDLHDIEPLHVAAWVEMLTDQYAPSTVKQRLAGVRELFSYLVTGGCIAINPASDVAGPKESMRVGKTPLIDPEDWHRLMGSIDVETPAGLRDLALLKVLTFTVGRISAVLKADVKDVRQQGTQWSIRLHEKGGKVHDMPLNHQAADALIAYMQQSGIVDEPTSPLFRYIDRKTKAFTERRYGRRNVDAMIKRRCRQAGVNTQGICCHSFRATGITAFLEHGGDLETAGDMANHADLRTTRLYDRRSRKIRQSAVEKIIL
jgi:site-specific recombinase XerD